MSISIDSQTCVKDHLINRSHCIKGLLVKSEIYSPESLKILPLLIGHLY